MFPEGAEMNRINEAGCIVTELDLAQPARVGLLNARYGVMMVQEKDKVIGLSLRAYGEWAQHEIDFLLSFLQPGMVVVDVGANIGAHTLAFADKVGSTGHVISFEPEITNYHMLAGNVALNELQHVTTFNAAVGPEAGYCRVQRYDPAFEGNFGMVRTDPEEERGTHVVRQMSIDDLNLQVCHLIKADVEGAELRVLSGATVTIERCKPVLYLEANQPDVVHRVLAFVQDVLGYTAHWHVTPQFNAQNFNAEPMQLWPNANPEFALVCTPPGMPAEGLIPVVGADDDHVKLVSRMTGG